MTDHTNSDEPSSGPSRAARPRWVFPKGAFVDDDLEWLHTAPAFSTTGLQAVPTPTCTCRCTCGAARRLACDEPELDAPTADYLSMVFLWADIHGRPPVALEKVGAPVMPYGQARKARPQYLIEGVLDGTFDFCPDQKNFLVGRHESTGRAYHVWLNGFDFDHGNGHFFGPDDTSRVRLRPLIGTDRLNPRKALRASTGWFGGDVNALLWVDRPEGDGVTAFLVGLLPRGDCKDPATVARAVEYARREYGADFPVAVALLP